MKKIIKISLVFIMCLSLVACSNKYEDTNGKDDFTLQTITDENIINLETGSSGLIYKEENIGDLQSKEYSAKNHNGVDQLYYTDFILPSDITVYIGHMNVKSGNFKLAVINEGKIIKEIPLDSFSKEYVFEDLTGEFAVHVAGENAAFEFYIDIY